MRRVLVGVILLWAALEAIAADDSIFGTHWVNFQPIQVAGSLEGCQLVFMAVTADGAYLGGKPVAVNGSIILQGSKKGLVLALKIGLKTLTRGTPHERPAFAYLQTSSASTAKVRQQSFDGDEGYKVFVYNVAEDPILTMLKEIMSNQKVTIGYNRKSDGIDVLVPLNLMVADSEVSDSQKVLRRYSPDASLGFNDCTLKVIDNFLGQQK